MCSGLPVPGDNLGGRQGRIAFLGCCEGMGQLRLQPVESLLFCPLFVTPDQVPDIFADVLVGAVLTDIGRDEVAERAAEADGHGRGAGHGTLPSVWMYSI